MMTTVSYVWMGFLFLVIIPFTIYTFVKIVLDLKLPKAQTIICFVFFPAVFIFARKVTPKVTTASQRRLNALSLLGFAWLIAAVVFDRMNA